MSAKTNPYPLEVQISPDRVPKLVITGGSKLSGNVSVSGSKNSSLSLLAATLCCSGTCKLKNVPDLSDTRTMVSILGSLGAEVEFSSDNEVVVDAGRVESVEPDPTRIAGLRGGFFVLGPLLGRFGEAVVGLPGGCDIGARPVDIYVCGLRALGAVVEVRDNKVFARAANGQCLIGGRFELDYPSVGATQTLIMAACMAQGNTLLSNVAREPEIVELARFLTRSGARIEGAGGDEIFVYGSKNELVGGEYSVMADRIEAGTFLLAAAITRSRITLSPISSPLWLSTLIDKLSCAGCKISHEGDDVLEICARGGGELAGFDIKTLPYPGFPTDLQPQTMAFLSTCNGLSVVEETVFENRMIHVREFHKLGAKIEVCGGTALVYGKDSAKLRGARVTATDLRGGIALVLAGLAAEGVTEVNGLSHIDRGYENLERKLQLLGAHIKRFNSYEGSRPKNIVDDKPNFEPINIA